MEAQRWEQIATLFIRVAGLSKDERIAFLDDACRDDPELRRELESLLAAHSRADESFLDTLDTERIASLTTPDPPKPERVGSWRVLEEIGRGGMGIVYEARRDDGQFEQPAALKLIRRQGNDNDQILQRFLRERQILARMEHPGIARLLDGGVTPDGRPWFALERIDGVPLNAYCDRHELDLEARLQIFNQVCSAVEYAHRNLVVHRDLKPSNVLVDAEGRVKLLDFGIAKLLQSEAPEASLTAISGSPMTPGYGAPELLLGGAITTATDVYSLGVILYELVSGQTPFNPPSGEPVPWLQLAAEPPKLSSLVSPSPWFRRGLDSDLDTIAAKTIELDPQRRYVSAEALREDIERFLRGEPVRACPDSLAYRAKKFLGRHRAGVIGVLLVTISLLVGLSTALWQADIAAYERDIAREEVEQADQVKRFLIDLFRASNAEDPDGQELTAKQLLERGLERIKETEPESRPDLQIELLTTAGEIAMALGDHQGAIELFQKALAIDPGPEPRNRLRIAAVLNGLGETQAYLGDFESATSFHRKALAIRLQHAGPDHPQTAQTHNNLGVVLGSSRQLPEAVESYEKALAIYDQISSQDPADILEVLVTRGNLSTCQRLLGNYPEAKRLLLQVIQEMEKRGMGQHFHMVIYLSELGTLEQKLGNYVEAEKLRRAGVELSTELWGETHPDTCFSANNFAVSAHLVGNDTEAVASMRHTLQCDIEVYGPEHPYVASARDNLARTLLALGNLEEAIDQLELSNALHLKVPTSSRAQTRHYLRRAWAHLALGDVELADQAAERALLGERQQEPSSPSRLAEALIASGFTKSRLGLRSEAEALYLEALESFQSQSVPDHPEAGLAYLGLGNLYLAEGRLNEARSPLERAAGIWKEALPEHHWRLAEARLSLGELSVREGDSEKGLSTMREAISQLQQSRGESHWRTLAAIHRLDAVTHGRAVSRAPSIDSPTSN